MHNKILRYLSGFILLAFILAAFYYSKIFLFIVSVIFIIITMIEYRSMLRVKEIYPHKVLPELVGILSAYIFIFNHSPKDHTAIIPVIMGGFIFSFILTVIKNKKPYILTSLTTIGAILFILSGLYIIKITYFFEHYYAWYFIVVYFISVLGGDFAASRIGPKIKPIHIAPEISPNKTLAGSIANLVVACLACLLFKLFLNFSLINCIFLGIVISVFSQFGDLTMSLLKRDIGIKHSSTIFLNYGGILDRMDSFLISAPALYYCLCAMQILNYQL